MSRTVATLTTPHKNWPFQVCPFSFARYDYYSGKTCSLRLKCDGTRAETTFRLSAYRTSPYKSAGASVQSTAGSRGVRFSGSNGSNARYTMFRSGVESTDHPLHSPVSPSLPLPRVTVCHHISTGLYNWMDVFSYDVTLVTNLYYKRLTFISCGDMLWSVYKHSRSTDSGCHCLILEASNRHTAATS
jgi:hypothetical protein